MIRIILLICTVSSLLFVGKRRSAPHSFHGFDPENISNTQRSIPDTSAYLQDSIISQKEKYLHKEFNTLLTDLHVQIKTYSNVHNHKPGQPLRGITLFFDDDKTTSSKFRHNITVPTLMIYFEKEFSQIEAWKIQYKSNDTWMDGEKRFYGKMIVKDIK
jgi:hypothetical protein